MAERASEVIAVLGTIDPMGAADDALLTSDEVNVSMYDSILFVALAGTVCSSGNVLTMSIYEGTTGAVTNAIDTVTRVAGAGDTGYDDFQLMYDLDCSHMSSPAYTHVKMTLGVTTGKKAELTGLILGINPGYHPASDHDLSSLYTITKST